MTPASLSGRIRWALSFPFLLTALACGGRGLEPVSVVPADADAAIAIASARVLARRLAPTVERLPEAVGALDLARSLVGTDLREPERTRQEGLDPERGLALAWHRDALLVLLPVDDRSLAGRRLGLRLARLGLVEADPAAGVRRFARDPDDGLRVALRVDRHLAVACFARGGACDALETLPLGGPGFDLSAVRDELGLADADVAGLVRNRLLQQLGDVLGLPVPKAGMAGAMLGDLRFAASLDGGLAVRAAVGAVGEPFASTLGGRLHTDESMRLAVDAGGLPAPWLRELLARLPGGNPGLARRLAGWDGRLLVAVPSRRSEHVTPLLSAGDLSGLAFDLLAGFRTESGASEALRELAAALGPAGARVEAVDGDPGNGISFERGDGLVGFAGRAAAVGWWASGEGAAGRAIALGTRPDETRRRLDGLGGRLVRVQADPGALIEAWGVTAVDFVRHLATGVRSVEADLAFEGLRLVLDAAVRVR